MGAWDLAAYKKGVTSVTDDPLGMAILAVKRELNYNGYVGNMNIDSPAIGASADKEIRLFQTQQAITVDGIVGPQTALRLFRKRSRDLETSYGLKADLLSRLKSLESANDPGAVGVSDQDDHGLVQINVRIHPTITVAQAHAPSFAMPYAAAALAHFFVVHRDWDASAASWNVGAGGAADWLGMNKPKTGGPTWFPDLYARATHYVSLLWQQPT